jgi:hypothetical protein
MATYPNKSSLYFGIAKFIVPLFLILYGALLSAQMLEIRLVNGRNGRPMAGAASHVNVWVGTERKAAIVIPTDVNGVARLQLTLDFSKVNIPNPSNDSGDIVVDNPILLWSTTNLFELMFLMHCVDQEDQITRG